MVKTPVHSATPKREEAEPEMEEKIQTPVSEPAKGELSAAIVAASFRSFTDSSVWTIKGELWHLVEVRPTRPTRTAFEIINYFKCEIFE